MSQAENSRVAIQVSQLNKRVADATGELSILHDIEFTAQAGETVAIVGASGSGKSTLLGILAGWIRRLAEKSFWAESTFLLWMRTDVLCCARTSWDSYSNLFSS